MGHAYSPPGYVRKAYIAEKPGCYPAVRFRYRRMSAFEGMILIGECENITTKERIALEFTAIAGHLIDWDVTGPDGEAIPVTRENLERLDNYYLYIKILNIVKGWEGGDVDPETGVADPSGAADEKNSEPG